MRINNENLLIIDGATVVKDLSADFTIKPVWLGHSAMSAIQLVFSGSSPTGAFKLQGSCDTGNPAAQGEAQKYADVANWTDIANSSTSISANGSVLWNLVDPGYVWVRVVWTFTSGTGTVTSARANIKGI